MKEKLVIYIAGKVSKTSSFGTHHWRQSFLEDLIDVSRRNLLQIDPLEGQDPSSSPWQIFAKDCRHIKKADALVVYLSDDISVGGSQEILIAKYLEKPVIGYAPYGGKFNGSSRKMLGKHIEKYKDPFVFSTCDVVCGTLEEVGESLKNLEKIQISTMSSIMKKVLS